MNRLKPFIKSLGNQGVSETYNFTLSLNKNGVIMVTDFDTEETVTFKDWLQNQQDEEELVINDIEEELKDQLYEDNLDYFNRLKGEEYQLLLKYRENEYGEDDDDDESCENLFIRDQSDYGVSLKDLVAELVKKRNKGLRQYSDKTKEKAKKTIVEWLEMCRYLPYTSPAGAMEEIIQYAYEDDGDYFYEFSDYTPEQIAAKAIENYPKVCSTSVQKNLINEISDSDTAERMCSALLKKLQEAFPAFYKKVKQCKNDDKESVYCKVRLKKAHQFNSLEGERTKTKILYLFDEDVFVGKYWDPCQDILYSARDYMWLIEQIPNMTLGPIKYSYAD